MPDLKQKTLIEILIVAVVLLLIGEIYIIFGRSPHSQPTAAQGILSTGDAAGAQASVIPPPDNYVRPIGGIVDRVEGTTIVLKETPNTPEVRFAVTNATALVSQGRLKDAKTRDADMEAFRLHSIELMKDQEKNRVELGSLIAPSNYAETPIDISDVHQGAGMLAYVDGQEASGDFTALRIVVATIPVPGQ